MKKESPDNLFIEYLESISDINYGVDEKVDFLKDRYSDIIDLYKLRYMNVED